MEKNYLVEKVSLGNKGFLFIQLSPRETETTQKPPLSLSTRWRVDSF